MTVNKRWIVVKIQYFLTNESQLITIYHVHILYKVTHGYVHKIRS